MKYPPATLDCYTSPVLRMDRKAKRKWVKALRSNEYPQTRSSLRDSRGYCCLGVIAEALGVLYGAGGGFNFIEGNNTVFMNSYPTEDFAESVGWRSYEVNFDSDSNKYLPNKKKPITTVTNPVVVITNRGSWSLAELNDAGLTFSQIADLIDYFL